jgi:hypothetical protein
MIPETTTLIAEPIKVYDIKNANEVNFFGEFVNTTNIKDRTNSLSRKITNNTQLLIKRFIQKEVGTSINEIIDF